MLMECISSAAYGPHIKVIVFTDCACAALLCARDGALFELRFAAWFWPRTNTKWRQGPQKKSIARKIQLVIVCLYKIMVNTILHTIIVSTCRTFIRASVYSMLAVLFTLAASSVLDVLCFTIPQHRNLCFLLLN